ncbi:unnamed protein product [Lupinus luteus]|uniref:Protein kinase domain-containing protein n=1 Tax=Lupinus luteus TaxID=3873 RepID=A0AAV1YPA6_LUPLU
MNLQHEEHPPRPSWKCFSYEELFDATNGFTLENMVGKGGYAEVYKGKLNSGEEIAVKRLIRTSKGERNEKEFLNEIGTIGHVCHSNVLPLLGCCIDYDLYLVFELSTVGSVASLIHDEKTDVFAFGVFLLEVISGREPVDGSYQSLHSWAKPILNNGEIEKLVDPRLEGAYDVTQFRRLAFAASLCIRASSTWRPTMSEVLEVMEEGVMDKEKWKMAEEEEQEQKYWEFEDLEYDYDSSLSISFPDSTRST